MCVEKTPWEQVVDFHGHTCPGVAMGYRIAQVAERELGIRPTPESEIVVEAETCSCALDAFQIINKATTGRRNLVINEKGKHVYKFYYTNTNEILRIKIKLDVLNKMLTIKNITNRREKQNKSLEIIQFILTCDEQEFCSLERIHGSFEKNNSFTVWTICNKCQEPVKTEFVTKKDEKAFCKDCANIV